MPDLGFVRSEIERARVQAGRQRSEILQLQKAGISTAAAEALLQRMLDKIDALCAERYRLKANLPGTPLVRLWEVRIRERASTVFFG